MEVYFKMETANKAYLLLLNTIKLIVQCVLILHKTTDF